jgi:radical SAM protein with 4Fe4S-binding SPASM domain
LPFSAGWLLARRPDQNPSDVEACRLGAADCISLEVTDRASADEWIEAALRQMAEGTHDNFYCLAGKAAFAINPVGEMNVCLILPQPAARPREAGFSEAWRQVQHYVATAPPAAAACRDCEALTYCGRCPAWSMMENGTLTEPVPYLCEIARARKELYGRPG